MFFVISWYYCFTNATLQLFKPLPNGYERYSCWGFVVIRFSTYENFFFISQPIVVKLRVGPIVIADNIRHNRTVTP